MKRFLFDIDMPKWALFFFPLIKELEKDYQVIITSRGGKGYSELNEVLDLYRVDYISIGEYGGASLEGKLKASIKRQEKLIEIVKKNKITTIISGSVVDAARVGFGLGIEVINFYDMPVRDYRLDVKKILPQIKLALPLSTKVFKPFVVPDEIYLRLGLEKQDILEYSFLDPLIWLKDFEVSFGYVKREIPKIDFDKPVVVVREEEFKASYVLDKRKWWYDVVDELQNWDINLIIIPRYESTSLKEKFKKAIVLEKAIILQHLLAVSHLFIGGGGTINIEAAYFSVPVISTRSFISHYDKFLIDNKLMWHSNNTKEILKLAKNLIGKKTNSKDVFSKMRVDLDFFINNILG